MMSPRRMGSVRHQRTPNSGRSIVQLIDQQVVAHQQGSFHRFGRNLECLHNKSDHKHGNHNRHEQRLRRDCPHRNVDCFPDVETRLAACTSAARHLHCQSLLRARQPHPRRLPKTRRLGRSMSRERAMQSIRQAAPRLPLRWNPRVHQRMVDRLRSLHLQLRELLLGFTSSGPKRT